MQKLLFYTYSNWVFGKIHYDLARVLYPDFLCDVRCWTDEITPTELELIDHKYDAIVSTPEGGLGLVRQGLKPEKIHIVAHSDWDIFYPIEAGQCDVAGYDMFRSYGVICPLLQHVSFTYNVRRIPKVVPIGIFCDNYAREPATSLKTIGYFGKERRTHRNNETDIKRGYLARRVAAATRLELYIENDVHFTLTENLYKRVDLVLFCSLIEGNPYVALESFAAGVPVLGTGTGIFPALAATGGGGVLPFDEDDFLEQAIEVINELKDNHELYLLMRQAALKAVRAYDWSAVRSRWIDFLAGF